MISEGVIEVADTKRPTSIFLAREKWISSCFCFDYRKLDAVA